MLWSILNFDWAEVILGGGLFHAYFLIGRIWLFFDLFWILQLNNHLIIYRFSQG